MGYAVLALMLAYYYPWMHAVEYDFVSAWNDILINVFIICSVTLAYAYEKEKEKLLLQQFQSIGKLWSKSS